MSCAIRQGRGRRAAAWAVEARLRPQADGRTPAVERELGVERYAEILFDAGHRSAYVWCEMEAKNHGLKGIEVFQHYMKRLSQRGWAPFTVESVDPDNGRARVIVRNSVFVKGHEGTPRKTCYMFRGWFKRF